MVLEGIIESLKSTGPGEDDCAGLRQTLTNYRSAIDMAPALDAINWQQDRKTQARDLNAALLAAENEQASNPTDANQTYIGALQTALVDLRVQIAQTRGDPDAVTRRLRTDQVARIYELADAVMKQTAASEGCRAKHPNLAVRVGAEVLATSAGFVGELSGVLILASGRLVESVVDFIHDMDIADDLEDLATLKYGEAAGCAFEALSQTYCEIRDKERILKKNVELQKKPPQCGPELKGVYLAKDLSSYLEFMNRLSSGSVVSSETEASKKASKLNLRDTPSKVRAYRDGAIAEFEKRAAAGGADNQGLRSELISELTGIYRYWGSGYADEAIEFSRPERQYGSTDTREIVRRIFPEDPDCGIYVMFRTSGTEKVCKKESGSATTCKDCSNLKDKPFPDLANIKKTDEVLSGLLQSAIDFEIRDLENNPNLALYTVVKDRRGGSAYNYLVGAKQYLDELKNDKDSVYKNRYVKPLIDDAIARVETALAILDSQAKPDDKLLDLKKDLFVDGDPSYVPREISQVVDADLKLRGETGKIDKSLLTIMRLSALDAFSVFSEQFPETDLKQTQVDAAYAEVLESLKTSKNYLGEIFARYLRRLHDESTTTQDPKLKESKQRELALNCMRGLLLPFEKEADPQLTTGGFWFKAATLGLGRSGFNLNETCKGAVLQSPQFESSSDPDLRLSYDELVQKTISDRVCLIYDFFRKSEMMINYKGSAGSRSFDNK